MCGIAGVSCRPGSSPDLASVDRMSAAIVHRGPDGEGRLDRPGVALRHRRLAIVDPEGGKQPFHCGNAAVIANGEIYNDASLRSAFASDRFQTSSDCEPPLHLWLRDGTGYTVALRGMYAIAVLESTQGSHELVLSRDPFGIKPLYVAEYEEGIAFASEAQALLAGGFGERRLRQAARDELLQLQFTTGSQTVFPGIRRLLPGETLRIIDGRIVESRQRNVLAEAEVESVPDLTDHQALARLDTALMDSVQAHLRADVPLGLFLSAGIDSSALLAVVHRLGLSGLTAWTARFDTGNTATVADESSRAAALAQITGAAHHVLTITPDMVWRNLPRIVAGMDDPTADYAIIPTWFLAKAARQDATVLLSGEGGDELFAGYGRYRRALRPWWRGGRESWRSGTFGRALEGVSFGRSRAWRTGLAALKLSQRRTGLAAVQAIDVAEWLPNDLLLKLDRCLMVHSVEGRTPLLDPLVARAVWPLPDRFKIRDGKGKWLLRRWLQDALPQACPFAPKQGFTVPIGGWIEAQAPRLWPLIARSPAVAALLPQARVKYIVETASRRGYARQAWTLLFFALWHRHHIECRPADCDTFDMLA